MKIKRKSDSDTVDIIGLNFDDYINLLGNLQIRECDLRSDLNNFKANEFLNDLITEQEVKINEVKDLIKKLKG